MPLTPSKFNLTGQIRDTRTHYLVNPLYGTADLLDEEEAHAFAAGRYDDVDALAARGYLVSPADEEKALRAAYLDFIEGRDEDEVQLFFVPWYSCNFACSYCYQGEYAPEAAAPDLLERIDALFAYIEETFAGRRSYLTLFGGEPLLPGATQRRAVTHLVEQAARRGVPLAVVTNGYHLVDYLELLATASIREIQVTLDGIDAVHDVRRPLRGGGGTFERIVQGIDAALAQGMPVNLRFVVDRDNMQHIPALADFAIARGWTANPLFKTQMGRNYELHSCQSQRTKLYTRLELYQDLYALMEAHPQVLELHRPAHHVARFLFDTGTLPDPLFDACPACKAEWAFDYTGRIYPCTANVGKADDAVGTFYPDVQLDDEKIAVWEDRDVLAIDACRSCSVQLICGGGCGAIAKNNSGSVIAPDCRPVDDLIELGMSLYFERQPHEPKECMSCQTR